MPESKCQDCGKSHWASSREELERWELEHHKRSFGKLQIDSLGKDFGIEALHKCRSFIVYDETFSPISVRTYNNNKLAEDENLETFNF